MKGLAYVFHLALIGSLCNVITSSDDVATSSSECNRQLIEFDVALAQRELWALKLFDTWGKIQSGLLVGNLHNPGHFTECIRFRHGETKSQHCMLSLKSVSEGRKSESARPDWREIGSLLRMLNSTLVFGICLPASCSTSRSIEYSNEFLREAELEAFDAICRTNDPVPIEPLDIFAIVLLTSLAALMIASTGYEVFMFKSERTPNKLLAAFSVYSNGSKLFAINESKSPNVIECLNGFRTLSIVWIIFGHRFDDRYMGYAPVFNAEDYSWSKNFSYLLFTNYDKPVGTFFVMGGLLATWSLLNALDKKTLNIPRMYLHRYLRYTPAMALMILIYVSLTKFMGTGPFFDPRIETCQKYWWTSLLHVSVYTNPNKICYDISWYLCVDFQLFVLSPLLIYPLWRFGRKAIIALTVLICLVIGCTFATSYNNEAWVYPLATKSLDHVLMWDRKYYFPTHLRIPEWTVGIMLGFAMYNTRGTKIKINKYLDAALWFCALSTLVAIVFGMFPFMQFEENKMSTFSNAFFNSFFRVGWALAVAWMIFACQNGSGGIIRWFLSLKQWQPLGRMGLSIYLVHRIYQLITTTREMQPIYWDFSVQAQKFFGDVLVSIFLGALLHLTAESPLFIIESYLHKKITGRK